MNNKVVAKRKAKAFKGSKKPQNAQKPAFSLESLMSRVVTPPTMIAHCVLLGIEIRYPGETIKLLTNQHRFDLECYFLGEHLKLPNALLLEELESLEYVIKDDWVLETIHSADTEDLVEYPTEDDDWVLDGIRQLVDSQELADGSYDLADPVQINVTMMISGDLITKQKRVVHLA